MMSLNFLSHKNAYQLNLESIGILLLIEKLVLNKQFEEFVVKNYI